MLGGRHTADGAEQSARAVLVIQHRAGEADSGRVMLTVQPGTAHTHGDSTRRVGWRSAPAPAVRVRLPFVCVDVVHDLTCKVAFNKQRLQPRVFPFQVFETHRL